MSLKALLFLALFFVVAVGEARAQAPSASEVPVIEDSDFVDRYSSLLGAADRVREIIDEIPNALDAASGPEGRSLHDEVAGLSDQITLEILEMAEDFTYEDSPVRYAQISKIWPAIEFQILVTELLIENSDIYLDLGNDPVLRSYRRILENTGELWKYFAGGLIYETDWDVLWRYRARRVSFFFLIAEYNWDIGTIHQMLAPIPADLPDGVAGHRRFQQERTRMMLRDFGMQGYEGLFSALHLATDERDRFAENLNDLHVRVLVQAVPRFAQIHQRSKLGDAEGVLDVVSDLIDALVPILAEDLPDLGKALTEVISVNADNADLPPNNQGDSTIGPTAAPVDAREELRFVLLHDEFDDEALSEIVSAQKIELGAESLAVFLVEIMAAAETQTAVSNAARALAIMGRDAGSATDPLADIVKNGEWNDADIHAAELLVSLGSETEDVAGFVAKQLDSGTLSRSEVIVGLDVLIALQGHEQTLFPRVLRFIADDPENNRAEGMSILKAVFEWSYNLDSAFSSGDLRISLDEYFVENEKLAQEVRPVFQRFVNEGTSNEFELKIFTALKGDPNEAVRALVNKLKLSSNPDFIWEFINTVRDLPFDDSLAELTYRAILDKVNAKSPGSSVLHYALDNPSLAARVRAADLKSLLASSDLDTIEVGASIAALSPTAAGELVPELAGLLKNQRSDDFDFGSVLRALAKAGPAAQPVLPDVVDLLEKSDEVTSIYSNAVVEALVDLGAAAAPVFPRLRDIFEDDLQPEPARLSAAMVLALNLYGYSESALAYVMASNVGEKESFPGRVRTNVPDFLTEAPADQRAFDTMSLLISSEYPDIQSSAIGYANDFLERAPDRTRETWSQQTVARILPIPKGTVDEERLVTALSDLGATEKTVFDRTLEWVVDVIAEARSLNAEEFSSFEVERALKLLYRIAVSEGDVEDDGRKSEAAEVFVSSLDLAAGSYHLERSVRRIVNLAPFPPVLNTKVFQALARHMTADGGRNFIDFAEALVQLADHDPIFFEPLAEIMTRDEASDEHLSQLQDILFQVLPEASTRVIGFARTPLEALYSSETVQDLRAHYYRAQSVVLLGKLGRDAIPILMRFVEADVPEHRREIRKAVVELREAILAQYSDQETGELRATVTEIRELKSAIEAVKPGFDERDLPAAERAIRDLNLLDQSISDRIRANSKDWWEDLFDKIKTNQAVIWSASFFGVMSFVFLCSLAAPIRTLNSYRWLARATDGKPVILGVVPLPLVFKWLVVNPYVLRAWVRHHLLKARENYSSERTVRERKTLIPLPILLDGEPLQGRPLEKLLQELVRLFSRKNIVQILITGLGGSGKTSLACRLGSEALDGHLARNPMIPVLLEAEFVDLERAISDQLRKLLDLVEPIETPLLLSLIRSRSLLVILDHYSELNDKSRAAFNSGFSKLGLNSFVVTSRGSVDSLSKVTKIEQMPIGRTTALSAFIEGVLGEAEVKVTYDDGKTVTKSALSCLENSVISEACAHLQRVSYSPISPGRTDAARSLSTGVTPLLAKAFANQILGKLNQILEQDADASQIDFEALSPSIPSIYLGYLEQLHKKNDPDFQQVRTDLLTLALACLRPHYVPRSLAWDLAVEELQVSELDREAAVKRLTYYTSEMPVLRVDSQMAGDIISFSHDSICEYLAASQVLKTCTADSDKWDEFLDEIGKTLDLRGERLEFLSVLQVVIESSVYFSDIPDSVLNRIDKMQRLEAEKFKQ